MHSIEKSIGDRGYELRLSLNFVHLNPGQMQVQQMQQFPGSPGMMQPMMVESVNNMYTKHVFVDPRDDDAAHDDGPTYDGSTACDDGSSYDDGAAYDDGIVIY